MYRAAGPKETQAADAHRTTVVRGDQTEPTWAIEFVHDRMAKGRTLRILSVVDTLIRECLALQVDTCLPNQRVT